MSGETELRRIEVYRALHRPNLFLGGERELMLSTGLAAATLIFVSLDPPVMLLGVGLWIGVAQLLRMMAKADPQMSSVYRRHLRYQRYYPAHSTPYCQS